MRKNYHYNALLICSAVLLTLAIASCKKDKNNKNTTPVTATPTKLGMYDYSYGLLKQAVVALKVGTDTTDYGLGLIK